MSGSQNAQFEILEVLGAGAFGIVAVVREAPDGEPFAVKTLRADQSTQADAASRLRDEARLLMQLAHPNILQGRGLLDLGGRPVLAMEWVQGVSLERLVREFGQGMPLGPALVMVRHIAAALDHAWRHTPPDGQPLRVVHRDIKPANVLLSVHGELKVVDFGIAKNDLAERETNSQAFVLGSRGFVAPERMDGDCDHPSVDIYALAMTAFQLFTSRVMSLSPRPELHASKLRHNLELMQLDALPEYAGAQLRQLLSEMAEYDPEVRPTAAQVVERIDELIATLPAVPGLIAFAEKHVAAIYGTRARKDPRTHPLYGDLLHLGEAVEVTVAKPVDSRDADEALRQFLQRDGWGREPEALRSLLQQQPTWTSGPFLEVVERARRPWWRFWVRTPDERELQLAMEMLLLRVDPVVVERCRPLASHDDLRVAEAALTLLERGLPQSC